MSGDQDPFRTEASDSMAGPASPPQPQPAQVSPPPARQTPPPRSIATASPTPTPAVGGAAHDSFAERAAAELGRAYPERVARRTRRELLAMIERGRERARGYGFDSDEHIVKFLHCVMLMDNELAKPSNPDVAYVLDTLTVPNKPPERRIDRALNIAKKIAASGGPAQAPASRGGSPSPSPSPVRSPASAASRRTPPAVGGSPMPQRSDARPSRMPAVTADASAQSTKSEPPPMIDDWKPEDLESFPDIEGFRILEKIASGGMGNVYRAQDLQLDIEVAIKVVRSVHPAAQQQFLLEARAAAKLQHPHIIPVLRYEQYGQGGYCVMQLVKGQDAHRLVKSLREKVAHDLRADKLLELAGIDRAAMNPELRSLIRGPSPYYKMVAWWIAGVADALDRAHSEGIVHYDVKPSNMILSTDGRMMLGDFGLATLAGQQTQNSTCVGTPSYLSPEMLAAWASRGGTNETDARVDIWGLGCALYEMLAYKPAFDGTIPQVLRAVATSDPVPPRDAVWSTPAALERICLKALARNPDERYAKALEMAEALRDFLAGRAPEGDDASKSKWWGRKGKPKA
jgi:serine/threonine protein kinase